MKYLCILSMLGAGIVFAQQIFMFDANQATKGGMCPTLINNKITYIPCKITFPDLYDPALPIKDLYYQNAVDYPGNDIQVLRGTDLNTCFRACYNNPACVAVLSNSSWSGKVSNSPHIPGTDVQCWLKSKLQNRRINPGIITWGVRGKPL